MPRPSFLEHNLHRGAGASIKQHYLFTYARSFAAVIRGQFQNKAQDECSRGALRQLVACRFVQVCCAVCCVFVRVSVLLLVQKADLEGGCGALGANSLLDRRSLMAQALTALHGQKNHPLPFAQHTCVAQCCAPTPVSLQSLRLHPPLAGPADAAAQLPAAHAVAAAVQRTILPGRSGPSGAAQLHR